MSVVTKDTGIFLGMRWNPIGAHHMYYGFFLMWLGWKMMFSLAFLVPPVGFAVFMLGCYLAGDDIYQHWRQKWDMNPMYHSPVHKWYGENLYTMGWIRNLNIFVDGILDNIRERPVNAVWTAIVVGGIIAATWFVLQ
jgi:hypothetical protein